MGLTAPLPVVGGTLGPAKSDRSLQIPDSTHDLAAAEWNAAAAAVEGVCAEVGLHDGTTAGSLVARATALEVGKATTRISFGADITTGTTATDTLAHDTHYNLDASSGAITITINTGTAGDEISLRVTDLTNSITLASGTATPTYYGKNAVNVVDDRITLFWRTATLVDVAIVAKV